MRFLSFEYEGRATWGALVDESIIDLSQRAPGIRAALAAGRLPTRLEDLPRGMRPLKLHQVELLPPVPDTGRIFCIGLNYAAHREEAGRKATSQPVIFVRFASSVVGHARPLLAPPESETFDFEGELAVIIGRAGRRIPEADALAHVAGYACFLDGSIRKYQFHTGQYTPGKNFDQSGAFGPWLTGADEVGDPNGGLRLQARLNGQVVQEATTAEMIFSVPSLITYLSTFTRLEPGDVIATGTPGGVGFTRTPPLFMKAGDQIEVEIEKVGLLANPVVAETT